MPGLPFETGRRLAAHRNADAEAEILRLAGVLAALALEVARRHDHAVRIAAPAVACCVIVGRFELRQRHRGQRNPQDEEHHVADRAPQPRQQIEPDRQHRRHGQARQAQCQHRFHQFDQVDRAILRPQPLRHETDTEPHEGDRRQHQQVTGPLRQQIGAARHRRRYQQLPDAGLDVAHKGATDDIEATEAEQAAVNHRQHHADPGAGIEAALAAVHRQDAIAGARRREAPPGGDHDDGQHHPEARTTDALAQVGLQDGEKTKQCLHVSACPRRNR